MQCMSPNEIVNRHVDLNIVAGNNIQIYNQYCNLPTMHCKFRCCVLVYMCPLCVYARMDCYLPSFSWRAHHQPPSVQYQYQWLGWQWTWQWHPAPALLCSAWFCLGLTLSHLGSGWVGRPAQPASPAQELESPVSERYRRHLPPPASQGLVLNFSNSFYCCCLSNSSSDTDGWYDTSFHS